MSSDTVTVDYVTRDEKNGELVLYFVEDGPWPSEEPAWKPQLMAIQDRILRAVDAAVDGGVAEQLPDAKGMSVRVQVDSPSGCPPRLQELVDALHRHVSNDADIQSAIQSKGWVRALRVVTGHQMGRFLRAGP